MLHIDEFAHFIEVVVDTIARFLAQDRSSLSFGMVFLASLLILGLLGFSALALWRFEKLLLESSKAAIRALCHIFGRGRKRSTRSRKAAMIPFRSGAKRKSKLAGQPKTIVKKRGSKAA